MSYVLFTWKVEKVCSKLSLVIVLSCIAHGKVREQSGFCFSFFVVALYIVTACAIF